MLRSESLPVDELYSVAVPNPFLVRDGHRNTTRLTRMLGALLRTNHYQVTKWRKQALLNHSYTEKIPVELQGSCC